VECIHNRYLRRILLEARTENRYPSEKDTEDMYPFMTDSLMHVKKAYDKPQREEEIQ
jgi:hypothetical protein